MVDFLRILLLKLVLLLLACLGVGAASPQPAAHAPGGDASAEATVAAIIRADYEADRPALARLRDQLARTAEARTHPSRIAYWRGFAMWRKAINGFNDGATSVELDADLRLAAADFEEALRHAPGFVDATAGLGSSLGFLGFLHRDDRTQVQELLRPVFPMLTAAMEAHPDHPRLLWVLGPMRWNAPPDAAPEARQARAIASYERGLEAIRRQAPSRDPLDPSWGEPELLMSLAWSHLNKATPDVAAAERYAREALALVPHWHYVRDILLKQIEGAKNED